MAECPIFDGWDAVPPGLRPANDLRFEGLEPRGEPVALLRYGGRTIELFRAADAAPRERRASSPDRRSSADPEAGAPRGSDAAGRRAARRPVVALPDEPAARVGRGGGGGTVPPDPEAACAWIRALLRSDFVVLDTETTGLGYDDEIVEIGILGPSGDTLLETLIRPRSGRIAPAATRVHGLTSADLAGAPSWSEVHDEVLALTRGRRVIAWNAVFDERMIRQTAVRSACRGTVRGFECAMRAYACARGLRFKRASLARAAAEMGILPSAGQRHRSCDDARLSLEVLMRAAGREHERFAAPTDRCRPERQP